MALRAGPTSDLTGAAEHVLASWTAEADSGVTGPDLGPVTLASLLPDGAVAQDGIRAWLRAGTRCRGGLALFGGTSGLLAGLRLIADRRPCAVAAARRASMAVAGAAPPWRTTDLAFTDYDLVGGAAGVVLAQLTGDQPVCAELLAPAVGHLVRLAGRPGGFRIGGHAGHDLVGWAQGGVVTGLAHGVAGPLVALSLAARHVPGVAGAVRGLAEWLASARFADASGIVSWPRRVPEPVADGPVRRQGWCYGSPGVGWALWTAGEAIGHSGPRETAVTAMRTLCAGYEPDRHLDHDPLGVCHGAAGVLLVADAFARHAELAEAAELRAELTRYLTDRLDEVTRLDPTLLSGAPGVLAALLTAGGGDRGWLRCIGLY